tara:strand:- start:532 stop:870 length:339 start_codon:yes stop_codon:yes gene_type:complete
MLRIKIFITIIIYSFLLIGTSVVKNKTRETEKKISNIREKVSYLEKDLNETELDYSYLTSPAMIDRRIENLDNNYYIIMEYSKIFENISNFINLNNKFLTLEITNEKKIQKR